MLFTLNSITSRNPNPICLISLLTAPPLPVSSFYCYDPVVHSWSCGFNHSLIAHYSCFALTEHAGYKVCTLSDAVFLWSVQSSVTSCFRRESWDGYRSNKQRLERSRVDLCHKDEKPDVISVNQTHTITAVTTGTTRTQWTRWMLQHQRDVERIEMRQHNRNFSARHLELCHCVFVFTLVWG